MLLGGSVYLLACLLGFSRGTNLLKVCFVNVWGDGISEPVVGFVSDDVWQEGRQEGKRGQVSMPPTQGGLNKDLIGPEQRLDRPCLLHVQSTPPPPSYLGAGQGLPPCLVLSYVSQESFLLPGFLNEGVNRATQGGGG